MFQRTNHFINKRLQTQAINDENKTSLRDIFEDIFIYKVSIKEHMRNNSSKRIMAHKTVFWVEAKNVYFLIRFTLR
jgi:hypothetical protein